MLPHDRRVMRTALPCSQRQGWLTHTFANRVCSTVLPKYRAHFPGCCSWWWKPFYIMQIPKWMSLFSAFANLWLSVWILGIQLDVLSQGWSIWTVCSIPERKQKEHRASWNPFIVKSSLTLGFNERDLMRNFLGGPQASFANHCTENSRTYQIFLYLRGWEDVFKQNKQSLWNSNGSKYNIKIT